MGLGIKLGPALKIYKHIVKLQSRVGDNWCAKLSVVVSIITRQLYCRMTIGRFYTF